MFSVSDFVTKYSNYSNDELLSIQNNIDGYSKEAQEALRIVIDKKGGIEKIVGEVDDIKIIESEVEKIKKETFELGIKGVDLTFIKNTTTSKILLPEKLSEIIQATFIDVELYLEDQKIKTRTIFGSVLGGLIASIIGGILWGLQMIYSNKIFFIFGFGLVLLCYGIIKVSTGQSKNNKLVLVATIISVLFALIIGQVLYEIIGVKEI